MKKLLLLTLLCGWLLGCKSTLPPYDYSKEPDPRKSEFVIGVTDRLSITVWKNRELSVDVPVRPDGKITMPLVQDLVAAGKTPTQLRKEISEKLKAYVSDPAATVTVAILEVNSYQVTVSGNVLRAGSLSSKNYLTVSEAIAQAGGPTRFADSERVVVVRKDPKTGAVRRIPINYEELSQGEHLEQNIVLLPGDTVHVP
jgi:polysaccharide biosynthesis/export protein